MPVKEVVCFWFRRDLRLTDNAGLYYALKSGKPVLPVFIFDTQILDKLEDKKDRRVQFIHQELERLQAELCDLGSALLVKVGKPAEVWQQLITEFSITEVFCNRDYEPEAIERDKGLYTWFEQQGIAFKGFKDQVIFDKQEIVKGDGTPFLVFTPYMKQWKAKLNDFYLKSYPVEKYISGFLHHKPLQVPALAEIGFSKVDVDYPARTFNAKIISHYHETRNFPAVNGTSRLSIHLRFGTISIRELVRFAQMHNETYLNELIWREFFMMVLYFHPHSVNKAIKPKYDQIEWEHNEAHFTAWCAGKTGYPIVDAGMREMNATGYMHNRVRMIVASFLTKHLLIDWRLGEAYFAQKLLDYEQSSNIGGWQWAAGSGCDAAPYFRVFNPITQAEKFDPKNVYIKKWVPEYGTSKYPAPIIDHKFGRERALARYKEALQQ